MPSVVAARRASTTRRGGVHRHPVSQPPRASLLLSATNANGSTWLARIAQLSCPRSWAGAPCVVSWRQPGFRCCHMLAPATGDRRLGLRSAPYPPRPARADGRMGVALQGDCASLEKHRWRLSASPWTGAPGSASRARHAGRAAFAATTRQQDPGPRPPSRRPGQKPSCLRALRVRRRWARRDMRPWRAYANVALAPAAPEVSRADLLAHARSQRSPGSTTG